MFIAFLNVNLDSGDMMVNIRFEALWVQGEPWANEDNKMISIHKTGKMEQKGELRPRSECTGLCPVNIDDNKCADIKFIHYKQWMRCRVISVTIRL